MYTHTRTHAHIRMYVHTPHTHTHMHTHTHAHTHTTHTHTHNQIDKLRRVLVGFSWYDPQVGYCQGLNRLAAIALLFLDEEDAFWCLICIVHYLLPPDYYSRTLLGSQTDQACVTYCKLNFELQNVYRSDVRRKCVGQTVCDYTTDPFCLHAASSQGSAL